MIQLDYTLQSIDDSVKQFWNRFGSYHLFAFSGEMGAGKTTFIHKLCDYLQVEDVVSSPTFALINEYHFADSAGKENIIYHLDWYRLKGPAEAITAGMEDCIDAAHNKQAYCFVEWPEKATELLRQPYVQVNILATSPTERRMTVTIRG